MAFCLGGQDNKQLNKDELIKRLTNELPVLRAKIGVSQDELSNIIGISRQTYSAIETGKRQMSWNTFLSLVLVFGCNEKTSAMIDSMKIISPELSEVININNRKDIV